MKRAYILPSAAGKQTNATVCRYCWRAAKTVLNATELALAPAVMAVVHNNDAVNLEVLLSFSEKERRTKPYLNIFCIFAT